MVAHREGRLIYWIYKAVTRTLSPVLKLHLHLRLFRGFEHPERWPERFGLPSAPRPARPLLWFHAVSIGEGMTSIPVIKECIKRRPEFSILITTTTVSSLEVLKDLLPNGVLHQFSPVDTPAAVDSFIDYWNPTAIVILENELWPNLVMGSARKGIKLALLNARVSSRSLRLWSFPISLSLASFMLSRFSLIVPLSNLQGIRFQLLGAPIYNIHFAGDLKYAVQHNVSNKHEDLRLQLARKVVWMASSIHKGEEKVFIGVHKILSQRYNNLVTIIVPRHVETGKKLSQELEKSGYSVALRSKCHKISDKPSVYVVDTLGELKSLYSLSPIAVIGGSFCPLLNGHNLSEAAAAGCAVLTGPHVGHFAHMIQEMQCKNPLAVLQVSDQAELENAIIQLLDDPLALASRRAAAQESFSALSCNIINNVWKLLDLHILSQID